MKNTFTKVFCMLMVLVMLCAALPAAVWAEAGAENTETTAAETTTTTAAPTVELTQLRIKGSNEKIYLSTPNLSSTVNEYSFAVPDWMETVTVTFSGKTGIAATCSNGQAVISSGTAYSVSVELTGDKQSVVLSLDDGTAKREITVVVNRRTIDCYIEDIMLYNGDNEINPQGDAASGNMTFTLPSGTLSNVSLRVKPRHENTVTIANTTKKTDGSSVMADEKKQLTINQYSTFYPINLCTTDRFAALEEGTNKYYVEVTAGTVTRTCNITIIVGDPAANAPTTTTTTTTTTAVVAPIQTTAPTVATLPSSTVQTLPGAQGGSGDSMLGTIPPVLWVLIGLIALVVIGSCIFMIVSMTASNRRAMGGRGGYGGGYDYGYDYDPPRRRRRNLTEYMDDEYYDDYGGGYGRDRGGRYDDYAYDDYEPPRRSGRYDSYNEFDSFESNGYESYDPMPRRSSNFDDFDDFDNGGYGGGY